MIPASVGFQCPDDVRAGGRTVRQGRTSLGGRVAVTPGRVSLVLLALNVVVFLLDIAGGSFALDYGNIAVLIDEQGRNVGVSGGHYYRLLTAAFLHANTLHLFFNMTTLMFLGPPLEAELGRLRFGALYLVSALGGSTASYVISEPGQLGVGASGALFGLAGAYLVVNRKLGRETGPIVGLLAVNLAIGFLVPVIDWRAHLGGLATGAVLAVVLAYAPRARRDLVQLAGFAAVALLLAAIVAARTAQLTG